MHACPERYPPRPTAFRANDGHFKLSLADEHLSIGDRRGRGIAREVVVVVVVVTIVPSFFVIHVFLLSHGVDSTRARAAAAVRSELAVKFNLP